MHSSLWFSLVHFISIALGSTGRSRSQYSKFHQLLLQQVFPLFPTTFATHISAGHKPVYAAHV